ncbi:TPA: hypothetical protein SL784_002211 [Pseudomonas aeruginosa]|nr:hypothetical protein [Pseudomonas aeruginosa]HEJ5828897.1 hypothetical protein [Pseudomonas aeruginosa]HEJ5937860.1 hypothetical protein [Pseudomonas aeruginosa]HEK0119081.1 hypothetical protein [Pseudomonas aeruginosa]
MTETASERLARIRASIDRVLEKGQRFRKGDRQVDLAELASLRMLEEQAKKDLAREKAIQGRRGRSQIYYGKI